ncbi:bacterial translation initiation factor 2 (bIF-2) [Bryocella elongata]|uniref:Translation initiation factor IF-2 n=1 Tax=Bryocella elongata TaxID=863522 RepID=A0A1H5WA78_9BACT|nr:translation initiation factor IF-2 [Bryocella elongata]SEF96382.1 bacterial translation initiation factor 2 (bIF-2) [Bryocella elongata]
MSKVRINDLARELEVKSKPILDALIAVGVTEKKTHSSSIEEDEAEKVRAFFNKSVRTAGSSSRQGSGDRPRFDLSHASKPGDALKAILERKQAETVARTSPPPAAAPQRPAVAVAPPSSRPVVAAAPPRPAGAPVASAPVVAAAPRPVLPAPTSTHFTPPADPSAPPRRVVMPQPRQAANVTMPGARPVVAPGAPRPVVGGPVVARPGVTSASAVASVPPAAPVVVRPPAAPAVPAAAAAAPVVASPAAAAPQVSAAPAAAAPAAPATPPVPVAAAAPVAEAPVPVAAAAAPVAPAVPGAPVRRVIMPQTGPRPTYTAPAVVPGTVRRPIFERPRPGGPGGPGGAPGAPGMRPGGPGGPMGPGGRRPMHPTRTFPGGPGGGPGGPGGRPGFPPRPGFGGRPGGGPGGPGRGPGLLPPAEAAPAPGRPRGGAQRGRGGPRYEKNKEVALKGYAPSRGAAMIPQGELPITKHITVTEGISVKDLAEKLGVRGKDLIATLLMKGVFVTVNQSLDAELVKEVSRQFGADTNIISVEEQIENEAIEDLIESTEGMVEITRAPVVTIMGHVDHGKTSLLDAIRSTDVAGGEAGGITQHIGAYKVRITKEDSAAFGREIVFLDTPGHEAFTRMRARGAKITDIVVVVVAADDGVMPQTLEAIDHAKAAKVPIIVAVNKIDKPDADPTKVMNQLAARGVQATSMGGDVEFVEVSAKKRLNLDSLEEMILLVADTNEQKAQPERPAVGTVIEAKLDRGRGAVASILVQNGTLRTGDSYIVGNTFGKVRAMFDDRGREIKEAGPSTPVEILGLESMPDAGDTFVVMADRDRAKEIARYRTLKEREAQLAKTSRVSLEGLAEQIKQAGMKDLNIILKGDVQGSVEVLADSLQRMSTEKVRVKVLHSGVGAITESDVLLASASNAVVIGFNVRPDRKAQEVAERENVDIRLHSIIYELQDEMTKAMFGLLDAVYREVYAGRAEVLNVFKITKVGQIAGSVVRDGLIKRDNQVRVLRDGVEVWKGKIASLKRFKDDVSEVRQGVECGIDLAGYKDIKVGDIVEAFTTEKVAAELGRNTAEAKKEQMAELAAAKNAADEAKRAENA